MSSFITTTSGERIELSDEQLDEARQVLATDPTLAKDATVRRHRPVPPRLP